MALTYEYLLVTEQPGFPDTIERTKDDTLEDAIETWQAERDEMAKVDPDAKVRLFEAREVETGAGR